LADPVAASVTSPVAQVCCSMPRAGADADLL